MKTSSIASSILFSGTAAPCLTETRQATTASRTQGMTFAAPIGMPTARQRGLRPSVTPIHPKTAQPQLAKLVKLAQAPTMAAHSNADHDHAEGMDDWPPASGDKLPPKLCLGENLYLTPKDLLTKNMDQLKALPGVTPEHVPLIEMAMVHYGNMLHRLQDRHLLSMLEELKFTTEDGAQALADAAETRAHLDSWLDADAAPAMDRPRRVGGQLWLTPRELHTQTIPELMQTPGFVAERHSNHLEMAVAKFGGMPNRLINQSIPEVIQTLCFTHNAAVRALCEMALIHQSKVDFVEHTTCFDATPPANRSQTPRNTNDALDLQLAIKSGKTLAQIATDPALNWNSAQDLIAVHEAIKAHEKRIQDEPNIGLS
jgi:hypothetical protein